jgi:hypothetical protein
MNRGLVIKHLQQAERHVAEGKQRIERQRELVAKLTAQGHDTSSAIDLLTVFEQTQAMHIAGRDRIHAELAEFP